MKKWSGTVELKSRYKSLHEYTFVEANTIEEAIEIAKKKCVERHLKPIEILNVKLTEVER